MPFLYSPTVLRNFPTAYGNAPRQTGLQETRKSGHKPLHSKNSIANLINFIRNPIDNVGEIVEDWYEGNTKEERAKQQTRDETKQILYLRLCDVGVPGR
jgi:hypothetical protein